jgi:transcriptional regulator with GAF, ATPase, and Fis domain
MPWQRCKPGAPTIIGEAAAMKQVSQAIQRAAGTDTTVLLEGESGTGKELFARAAPRAQPARERTVCSHHLCGDSRQSKPSSSATRRAPLPA